MRTQVGEGREKALGALASLRHCRLQREGMNDGRKAKRASLSSDNNEGFIFLIKDFTWTRCPKFKQLLVNVKELLQSKCSGLKAGETAAPCG